MVSWKRGRDKCHDFHLFVRTYKHRLRFKSYEKKQQGVQKLGRNRRKGKH